MKLPTILHALKILLGMVEQVSEMISESKIPEQEQPTIEQEIGLAMTKLHSAKSKIAIDPAE